MLGRLDQVSLFGRDRLAPRNGYLQAALQPVRVTVGVYNELGDIRYVVQNSEAQSEASLNPCSVWRSKSVSILFGKVKLPHSGPNKFARATARLRLHHQFCQQID